MGLTMMLCIFIHQALIMSIQPLLSPPPLSSFSSPLPLLLSSPLLFYPPSPPLPSPLLFSLPLPPPLLPSSPFIPSLALLSFPQASFLPTTTTNILSNPSYFISVFSPLYILHPR
jgi:hypothetical protein